MAHPSTRSPRGLNDTGPECAKPREGTQREVQNILSDSMRSIADDCNHSPGMLAPLRSTEWYQSQGGGSGTSSLSCLSLPARSKIPLPVNFEAGWEHAGQGRSSRASSLIREASSPCLLTSNPSQKRTPPPVPPKPRFLARPKARPVLQRETSLPPNLDQATTPGGGKRGSFDWRPPRPTRERSFDSLASEKTTASQLGRASRIPIWKGSRESLLSHKNKHWESCSNIELRILPDSPDSLSHCDEDLAWSKPRRSHSVSRSCINEFQSPHRGGSESGREGSRTSANRKREKDRVFTHHKLRQSQSVDLYRAQLDEKDKTIAAMKQAAHERDWKLEKLKLNLQTFKSVGSLKDLSLVSPGAGMDLGEPDPNRRVCDYSTYMRLLQDNAQLQHVNRLLQSKAAEATHEAHENMLQTELRVSEAKVKDMEAMLQGQNVDLTLVEEKKQLQQLNLGLAERIAELQESESKILGHLRDSRDQAELLEFRMFELEEEKDKQSSVRPSGPHDRGDLDQVHHRSDWSPSTSLPHANDSHRHEEHPLSPDEASDSGCNTSCATDEDILEAYQDFRGEKVADTKSRLQDLVSSLPRANDKSLLLQSVALFETLLKRIHDLQSENEILKKKVEVESDKRSSMNDQIVLELEISRKDLQEARQAVDELTQERHTLERDLNATKEELDRKVQKNAQILDARDKLEVDLRSQISTLQTKLNTTMMGRQSESEMCEKAIMKTNHLENLVQEMEAKITSLREENGQLKEHLSVALESNTVKSVGSLSSEYGSSSSHHRKVPSVISDGGSDHPKTSNGTSSGVSSDLSDSDNEHHDENLRHPGRRKPSSSSSRSLGGMDESGIFDASTSTSPDLLGSNLADMATQTNSQSQAEPAHFGDTSGLSPTVSRQDPFLSPMLLRHASGYESCEELDDLRQECRGLVSRKDSLEGEIEDFKTEIRTLKSKMDNASSGSDVKVSRLEQVEYSLRNQLKEWEKKYKDLYDQNQNLLEEKCELEEAENDSRLNAQRWEQQYRITYDRNEQLSRETQIERSNTLMIRDELAESQSKEMEIRNDVTYLEALVQRYEQRIFDLEELEVELRDKLTLLEKACLVVAWLKSLSPSSKPPLPLLMEIHDTEKPASLLGGSQNEARMDDLETYIQALEVENNGLKDSLLAMTAEKDSICRSLEGTHEDKIERVIQLQDRINEMDLAARALNEKHTWELAELQDQILPKLEEPLQPDLSAKGNRSNLEPKSNLPSAVLGRDLSETKASEAANCQTIQGADILLAKVKANYEKTIHVLEEEKLHLLDQVRAMEGRQVHSETKSHLNSSWTPSEAQKVAELLERLVASERSVVALKDVIAELETREKEMSLKALAEERHHVSFQKELHDQESLIAKLYQIERDNQELSDEILRLKEIERRFRSGQAHEGVLNCRLLELEDRESSLQSEISDIDRSTSEREKLWKDKVATLSHELQVQRDTTTLQVQEEMQKQNVYRVQVEGLTNQVSQMKEVLAAQTTTLEDSEATFRSELTQWKNQLSFSNAQLRELDALNSTLQDEIRSLKASLNQRESEVRQLWQREETNIISINSKLRAKDEEIENLKLDLSKLAAEKPNSGAENELHHMLNYEGGLTSIRRSLQAMVENIKYEPVDSTAQRLSDIIEELQTLSYVICAQPSESDPNFDLFRCESEETIQLGSKDLADGSSAFPFFTGQDFGPKTSLEDSEYGLPSLESTTSSCSYHSSASTLVTSQLGEAQSRCHRLEKELTLATQECTELQDKLDHRDEILAEKTQEIQSFETVVEHLRQLNIRITEEHEREKVHLDSMNSRMRETQSSHDRLDHKCAIKDFLLRSLADLIKTATDLRPTYVARRLREATFRPSYIRGLDFTMESLCRFIENGNVSKLHQQKHDELSNVVHDYKESTSLDHSPAPWMIESGRMGSKELKETVGTTKHDGAGKSATANTLRVTRRVGADSLLLAWDPSQDTRVTGYMIFINSQRSQKIRSASRTKALLHGLDLNTVFKIGIQCLGTGEQFAPASRIEIEFQPDMLDRIGPRRDPPPTPQPG